MSVPKYYRLSLNLQGLNCEFYGDFGRVLEREGTGYRLFVMGDMNGWLGDRVREGLVVHLNFLMKTGIGKKIDELSIVVRR